MKDLVTTLRLRAEAGGLISVLDSSSRKIAELGREGERGGQKASKGLSEIDRRLKQIGDTSEATTRSLGLTTRAAAGVGAAIGAALGGRELLRFAGAAVQASIAAEETANKFDVVMGPAAARVRAEFEQMLPFFAATRSEMEAMSAGIQDLLVPMGLARDAAADLSVDILRLAGDLSSFNNVPIEDALNAIRSGLVGESEPLRRFGVDAREAALQTIALEQGLIREGQALDNTSRALAVFEAVVQGSTDAIGDQQRTVESNANQLRLLQRNARELSEDLGDRLVPAFGDLIGLGNGLVGVGEALVDNWGTVTTVGQVLAVLVGSRLTAALTAAAGRKALNIALSAQLATGWRTTSAAGTALAATTTAVASAGRGLLALLGGPVGLAVAAGSLAAVFGGRLASGASAGAAEIERLREQAEQFGKTANQIRLDEARDAALTLQLEVDELQGKIARLQGVSGIELTGALDELRAEVELNQTALGNWIQRIIEIKREEQEAAAETRNLAGATKEFAEALTDPIAQLRLQVIELTAGEQAAQDYQDALLLAAAAEQDAEDGTTANTDAIRDQIAERERLEGALEAQNELLEQQEEARKAAEEAAEDAAQTSRQANEDLQRSFEKLLDEMDPVRAEQRRITEEIERFERAAGLSEEELAALGLATGDVAEALAFLRDRLADVGQVDLSQADAFIEQLQAELEAREAGEAALREFNLQQEIANNLRAAGIPTTGQLTEAERQRRAEIEATTRALAEQAQTQEILDSFGGIGQNISTAVLNGSGLGTAIGQAFTAFGSQRVSEQVGDLLKGGLERAFERFDLSPASQQRVAESFSGVALGIGQALSGNLAQGLGTAVGSIAGSFIPFIGPALGSAIGGLIGGIFGGGSVPKFQVRGSRPSRATDAGTDRTEFTEFGQIDFAFRKIEDEAQSQIVRGFLEFDSALAQAIQDADTRSRVADRLATFGVSSRSDSESLEVLLQERLDLALSVFPPAVRAAVQKVGTTLEDQVQRLAESQAIEAAIERVQGIGLDFEKTIGLIAELENPGEGLAAAFERIRAGMTGFEDVLGVLGVEVDGTREGLARFVDGMTDAAGGIQALDGLFERVLQGLFGESAVLEQQLGNARGRAGELLGGLGLDAGLIDDPDAFRQQFAELLPTLDAEDATALLQAADAITRVIDLEEQLAAARERALEPVRDLAGVIAETQEALIRDSLSDGQSEIVSIRVAGLRMAEALREAADAAKFQGDLEAELADIHTLTAQRVANAIAQLEDAGRSVADRLFGSELDAVEAQIRALQDDLGGTADGFGAVADATARAREQLREFADSLLIGNLSPLTQGDQLAEARRQLSAASAAGDASAVQQLSREVLSIARDRFASGQQFSDIFDEVQSIVRGTTPAIERAQQVELVSSPALEALIAQRDELEAEQQRREEAVLGRQLAQIVADIAGEGERNFGQIADALGFELAELGEVLGLDAAGLESFIAGLQVDTVSTAETIANLEAALVAELQTQTQIWQQWAAEGVPIRFDPGAGLSPGAGVEPPPPGIPGLPPDGGGGGGGGGGIGPDPGFRAAQIQALEGAITSGSSTTTNAVNRTREDIVAALVSQSDAARETIVMLRRIADALESGGARGRTAIAS